MAKDDFAELSDEEKDLLKQLRRASKEEAETEIWIRDGDKEARLPFGQGKNWLQRWGFLLGDDELKPEPETEPEPEEEEPKGTRFGGRRVS